MNLVIIVNRLLLFIWEGEFMSCIDENLIRSFIENPGQCLRGYPLDSVYPVYQWVDSPKSIEAAVWVADMYFRSPLDGARIAHAEGISCKNGVATILHIYVETDYVRLGIGRALVKYLADELKNRYRVRTLLFQERSPRPHDPDFFKALGAKEIPSDLYKTSDWELTISD